LADREREKETDLRNKSKMSTLLLYFASVTTFGKKKEKTNEKSNWRSYVTSYNVGRKAKKKRKMFKVQN
jgi:hypothetical protein